MKSKFLLSLSVILFSSSLSLTGCSSSDTPKMPEPDVELVPVHFDLRFSGLNNETTRSLADGYKFSDGKSISELKCYVYNAANGSSSTPIKVENIDIKAVNDHRGGDISILLPKGQQFDVVFLGTSIPQTNPASKLYYNSSDRTLTVNYSTVSCNDEELDCFYAVQTNVKTETIKENPIELTRPFAQLNIGTGDYADYNSSTPVKNIAVTVDGIYNKINLMDGSVVGNPQNITFQGAALPTGQTFPVNNMTYLSMNYLLVNTRKLIDLTITVNHTNSSIPSKVISLESIAVERNYQTNVYGKLLLTGELSD